MTFPHALMLCLHRIDRQRRPWLIVSVLSQFTCCEMGTVKSGGIPNPKEGRSSTTLMLK
jgi:hypothetical protein